MTRLDRLAGRGAMLGLSTMIAWWPSPASACKPVGPDSLGVQRPKWSGPGEVELVDERIEINCTRERSSTRCHWRSTHVYEGAAEPMDGELRIDVQGQLDVVLLSIDGHNHEGGDPSLALTSVWTKRVHVEDASHVEIQLDVDVTLDTNGENSCVTSAGYLRHPLVSRKQQFTRFELSDSFRLEQSRPSTQLQVRAPRGWRISVHDGPRTRGAALDARVDGQDLESVFIGNRPIYHGPFIAGGVGFGPRLRPRLRAGWELSAPGFMVYSLAVEGDAVEEFSLVPAIEVALPGLWTVFPSFGLGVGVPVMLLPEARPGFRVQAAAHWLYAGLVGSFDTYPSYRGANQTLRGALMIQLSL